MSGAPDALVDFHTGPDRPEKYRQGEGAALRQDCLRRLRRPRRPRGRRGGRRRARGGLDGGVQARRVPRRRVDGAEGVTVASTQVGAAAATAVDADLGAVDACLGAYARWDAHADAWLVVAIESPADTVYGWRREAERRAGGGLSDEQVRDFVGRFLPSYEAYCPALYEAAAGGGVDAKPTLRLDVDTTRSPVGAVRGG